jgi:DnaJ-class molecular chaperone
MSKTHYEILGISREASEKEVKQAFRSLSMKYHPDKVVTSDPAEREQANTMMQQINEAYEVLGEETTRRQYNMELDGVGFNGGLPHGGFHQGFPPGFPPGFPGFPPGGGGGIHFMNGGGGDIGNIFEMLFSNNGGGGPNIFFHGAHAPPPTIQKAVEITLVQAYTGCTVSVDIERWVQQGDLKITETETISLNIPAGIDHNMGLCIRGKGNAYSDAVRGDVKIIIQVVNTTMFQRKGNDLHYKKQLTLKEALCGFNFQFTHLNGKAMVMNNTTTIIFNGAKKNINGLGMTAAGSLIVEFDVVFPTELSSLQREALMNIL